MTIYPPHTPVPSNEKDYEAESSSAKGTTEESHGPEVEATLIAS